MHLFTYGTLMFPEVWKRISIDRFPSQPAKLPGYAIYRVKDAVYPGIISADKESVVDGVLYDGIDEDTLFELDTYESNFYERIPVLAYTADGLQVECQAYIVPNSRHEMLSNEPWDADQFREQELEKYLHG